MNSQPAIVTPEAVVLDFERAGVASRTLAIVLDVLFLAIGQVILLMFVAAAVAGNQDVVITVVAALSGLGGYLAYFTGFEAGMQRTPGKMILGLRVIGADGTPVRFQQAFLRAVVGIFEFLMVPIGFVAVVVTLFSPRDQRVGDMAANTLVVRENQGAGLVASARFWPPPGYEAYAGSIDVGTMKTEHYELVRRFLLRAHLLNQVARAQLAVKLANPLAKVLNHTPPQYVHPELFLVCVAAAWQQAHAPQANQMAWR